MTNTELVKRLLDLSAYKHYDLSIGDEAADYITKLEAKNERLRKALEPFRQASKFFAQRYLDGDPICEIERVGESVRLQVGHLRSAALAMEKND